jgi:hypothetical protein
MYIMAKAKIIHIKESLKELKLLIKESTFDYP